MRNRRTRWVVLAALVLSTLSISIMCLRSDPAKIPARTGYQVSVIRNGQPVRLGHHDELPFDLSAIYPEIISVPGCSLTVEPLIAQGPVWSVAPGDRPMIEFLLLLPPATLLVCIFRHVIGLNSFGTFAPALLGLAFRDVESLVGVFVVFTVISAGWFFRRALDELHLLQVPRTALLLSGVVLVLLVLIAILSGPGPRAITLFPLVILTGMIERFWSMEEEGGTVSSLSVLATTLFMAGSIWLIARMPAVPAWMIHHPETLGLVMAGQLLLGRYTGLRVLELYRFRDMVPSTPLAASRQAA